MTFKIEVTLLAVPLRPRPGQANAAACAKRSDAVRECWVPHQRVPRQTGNLGHPQNSDPAFAPFLAIRRTIVAWQVGQFGAISDAGDNAVAA